MTDVQKQHYRTMEEDFIVWLDSGDAVTAEQVITKRMKMQQISSGFIYDEHKQPQWLLDPKRVPKLVDLKDDLSNQITDKVIIIAYYRATIDMLLEQLREFNPAVIRGGQQHDTDAEKERFNGDPSCRIIIGQEVAIKYGHTLMGTLEDPCQTIAYFENSYSLDDRAQTMERPQGEGQTQGITVLDYHSGGVEADIIAALQRKESIADAIMNYYGKI